MDPPSFCNLCLMKKKGHYFTALSRCQVVHYLAWVCCMNTTVGKVTDMEHEWECVLQLNIDFPNMFFAILHISLTLMFYYCTNKYIVVKLLLLHTSHCMKPDMILPCVLLHINHTMKV
jgi:hypothetical protein